MEDKKYDTIAERNQLRKANHKYYEMVAEILNDAGIYQKMLLDKLRDMGEMRNTKDSIKDIYREIGRKKFGIKSTQELTTIQAKEVEEDFTQAIQETLKTTLPPFPSRDKQDLMERIDKEVIKDD